MPRRHRLWHLLAPVGVALAAALIGWTQGHMQADDLIANLLGVPLWFAAPHLLYIGACLLTQAPPRLEHAGLFTATALLVVIGLLSWLLPGDPSGLPYLWLMYWPLCAALMTLLLLGWWLVRLFR